MSICPSIVCVFVCLRVVVFLCEDVTVCKFVSSQRALVCAFVPLYFRPLLPSVSRWLSFHTSASVAYHLRACQYLSLCVCVCLCQACIRLSACSEATGCRRSWQLDPQHCEVTWQRAPSCCGLVERDREPAFPKQLFPLSSLFLKRNGTRSKA